MATGANIQIVGQVCSVQALGIWLCTQSADVAVIEMSALGVTEREALVQMLEELPIEEALAILLLVENSVGLNEPLSHLLEVGISVASVTVSEHQLRCAIEAIASGFVLIHPEVTDTLFTSADSPFSPIDSAPAIEPLTPREVQVLNQVAGGLANRAIAKALNISEHTVKFHISAILSKLNVSSRTEAVSVGIRTGLVML